MGSAWGGRPLATHSQANECPLCGHEMKHTKDMVKHHGRWIHRSCAPGADDE